MEALERTIRLEENLKAALDRIDELETARDAVDDRIYGRKDFDGKGILQRLDKIDADRIIARWLIALLGGIGLTALKKYVPFLSDAKAG